MKQQALIFMLALAGASAFIAGGMIATDAMPGARATGATALDIVPVAAGLFILLPGIALIAGAYRGDRGMTAYAMLTAGAVAGAYGVLGIDLALMGLAVFLMGFAVLAYARSRSDFYIADTGYWARGRGRGRRDTDAGADAVIARLLNCYRPGAALADLEREARQRIPAARARGDKEIVQALQRGLLHGQNVREWQIQQHARRQEAARGGATACMNH